jgi:DNA polymerase-3 subunit epsilon
VQLAFTTVDELFALLEQAGEALDYREVWPRLFPVAHCPPELAHAMVDDIVRSDERFAWESDVHLGLAAWHDQRRDLADVAFTVVDLETTGATPGSSKITEIGAVRVEGGEQTATFSQLVDPGVHISAMITSITGIDDATVAGAPPIEEVLPRFVEFTAGTVLVAHNARFDLGFLDYELGKLMRCTFPRPALDTLRLARKLCPQQRCSLAALAYRFDTQVKPEHRALQDAQATAELLVMFLSWLQEQGMTTLEEVARFCEPGARRNYHKIALTDGLPAKPGVYVMRDAHGHALYIGKAENLRRRTRDHFLQRQAYHARQALELLERIETVETGSEFGALLLEQRLIARHRPHYNSHGTRAASYQYVKLSNEPYPRLYATPNLRDDGAYYAGPFRKASTARRFIDCLTGVYPLRTCARLPKSAPADAGGERPPAPTAAGASRTRRGGAGAGDHGCARADTGACLAPCRSPVDGAYDQAAAAVRRVLEGDGLDVDRRLQERQAAMVERLAFEQAGRLQRQREALERALRGIRRLRAAQTTHAVLAYPAPAEGRVRLWGVTRGAVVAEKEVAARSFTLNRALQFLAAVRAAEPPAPPLPASAIDEILLVHGWLQRHAEAVHVLDVAALFADEAARAAHHAPLTALAEELVARVRLCGEPAPAVDESDADDAFGAAGRTAAQPAPAAGVPGVKTALPMPAAEAAPGYAEGGAA